MTTVTKQENEGHNIHVMTMIRNQNIVMESIIATLLSS